MREYSKDIPSTCLMMKYRSRDTSSTSDKGGVKCGFVAARQNNDLHDSASMQRQKASSH